MLEVKNLTKRFGGFTAVDNVDFPGWPFGPKRRLAMNILRCFGGDIETELELLFSSLKLDWFIVCK